MVRLKEAISHKGAEMPQIQPSKEGIPASELVAAGELVHKDVQCRRCPHKGAVCIGTPGGKWMKMRCVACNFAFEIDGE